MQSTLSGGEIRDSLAMNKDNENVAEEDDGCA